MWNWGETSPVCRLKTSTAEAALLGEGPRLIPSLVFASHLGCHPPALWKLVSLYARHPKVWSFLILGGTSTLENLLMGDITLFISGNVILSFLRWVACIAIGSVLWLSAILTYNISFYFLPDLGVPDSLLGYDVLKMCVQSAVGYPMFWLIGLMDNFIVCKSSDVSVIVSDYQLLFFDKVSKRLLCY